MQLIVELANITAPHKARTSAANHNIINHLKLILTLSKDLIQPCTAGIHNESHRSCYTILLVHYTPW